LGAAYTPGNSTKAALCLKNYGCSDPVRLQFGWQTLLAIGEVSQNQLTACRHSISLTCSPRVVSLIRIHWANWIRPEILTKADGADIELMPRNSGDTLLVATSGSIRIGAARMLMMGSIVVQPSHTNHVKRRILSRKKIKHRMWSRKSKGSPQAPPRPPPRKAKIMAEGLLKKRNSLGVLSECPAYGRSTLPLTRKSMSMVNID
jgi:hypothetical protein